MPPVNEYDFFWFFSCFSFKFINSQPHRNGNLQFYRWKKWQIFNGYLTSWGLHFLSCNFLSLIIEVTYGHCWDFGKCKKIWSLIILPHMKKSLLMSWCISFQSFYAEQIWIILYLYLCISCSHKHGTLSALNSWVKNFKHSSLPISAMALGPAHKCHKPRLGRTGHGVRA